MDFFEEFAEAGLKADLRSDITELDHLVLTAASNHQSDADADQRFMRSTGKVQTACCRRETQKATLTDSQTYP